LRPFERLEVPHAIYEAMISHAQTEAPLECCGLLAGRIEGEAGLVENRYPLVNEAASPVEFVSEARGMFDATREIDRRGLRILAVYHSHPASRPVPSKTDLERNYSAEVVNIIISLQRNPAELAAWWLEADRFEPAEFSVNRGVSGGTP
jgi:proteasome lid subunit RPN8/RPN11